MRRRNFANLRGMSKLPLVVSILAMTAFWLSSSAWLTGCRTEKSASKESAGEGSSGKAAKSGDEVAVIETRLGTIVLEFFPDVAPGHVGNFKKLAREGFYDGTTFHRVIPDYIIQGGDPLSKDDDRSNDGTGGPGYTIQAEFNQRPHLRGTLSMARAQDPNSAGSQFFICLRPAPMLDGKYTVFGQVIKGMDAADRIANLPRDVRDNPLEPVPMEKVTIVAKSTIQ